ncbi:MAG: non-ribosomal peptide synthetase, partial [Methylocystaceae bacterium]
GKNIFYRELITRANRLAHHLVNLGVGPDVPVAVALGPSVDIVVAILAILKANGAYVPIDPSYPAARIKHILADSNAAAVITTREASAVLRGASSPLVSLDDDAATIEAMPATPPAVRAKPQNLAYLIYTSGSTGAPKGVMVSHSNAVASIMARRQYYAAPVEAYLLLSSIAFDSSVAGLFWTLFDGGRLCIPSEKTRRDPGALARIIEEQEISHVLCLPSFYSALSLLLTPSHSASLECVIVAGEECKPELAAQHIERLPQVALFNEYGPTECSVWSSAHRIASDDGASRSISIGRPIPGAEAFVISASGVLAPPGVPGELFVGGEGVARGYRGHPDLTADRFMPNPFGQDGGRLYRTGDRVRLRDDGGIEFLGRIDNQVKIRGFRVEPSEIEEALLRHLSVREAVVIASGESGAATKLFAYLVLDAGCEWSDLDLERHLSGRLPEYMIPTKVVLLDALPRLPNGKIDRSALPAPTSATIATPNDGPSGAVAALMKEIWREVLSLEQIHDDDDFFELGGNSLSAIQVIARVQQVLGQEMPVASIFEAAVFRDFVRAVESEVNAELMDDDLRALLDEIESAEESCAVDMILAAPLGGTHV